MKYKKIMCMLLAVALIVTACVGKQDARSTDGGGKDVDMAAKDSVMFGINAEPTTLDPKNGNDLLTFMIQYQIFDTLVREDEKGEIVPGLAEEWTISDDGMEINFKLRQGVKFHNGETMTADDVVYSIQRAIDSSFTTRITGSMDSVEKVDDINVLLKLKYPYGPIIDCMATANMSIVSQKAASADEDGFARNPVGTGPYMFKEWSNGEKLVFESFKDYYRGEASVKDLTFKIISDASTATVSLENGEINVLLSPAQVDRQNIIDNEKLTYYETEQSSFLFVAFNNENGIFKNKMLRQAVSYAIDRDSIVIGALEGVGAPLESPIPANCFGSPAEFKNNPYDIEKAKSLMAEAGYAEGFTVKLRAMESATYSKPAEIVQEQLRKIGINAEVELMERGAYLSDVYTDCNYEITVNIVSALVPDADLITYARYHGDYVGGGNNMARCSIPELNEALETGRTSQSEDERKAAYLRVSEIVRDEAIVVPVYSGMNAIAADKNLNGVRAHPVQKCFVYGYSWQ